MATEIIKQGCTQARTSALGALGVTQAICEANADVFCGATEAADELVACLTKPDTQAAFANLVRGQQPAPEPEPELSVPVPTPTPMSTVTQILEGLAEIDGVNEKGTDFEHLDPTARDRVRDLLQDLPGPDGADTKLVQRVRTFLKQSTTSGDGPLQDALLAARMAWGVAAAEPAPRDWERGANILRLYVQGKTPFAGVNFHDQFASDGVKGSEYLLSPGDQNSLFNGFRTGFGADYLRRISEHNTFDIFIGAGIDALWATRNGLMVQDPTYLAEFEEQSGSASWKEFSLRGQAKVAIKVGKYFWAIASLGAGYFSREGQGGEIFTGNAVVEPKRTDRDFDASSLLFSGGLEVCVGGLIAGPLGIQACAEAGFDAPINTDKDRGFNHLTSGDNEGYGAAKIGPYVQF